ncbi:MAG: LysM peptidoglycan-binding domain-containing protein [Planctomycetota bacterium]|jgi:nucleoid-associated protein YgaU
MTRENKLALVVGFALILFVGILVSDHFSIAQTQESANLVPASDTIVDPAMTDPDLLRFVEPPDNRPAPERAAPLVNPRDLPVDPLVGAGRASDRSPSVQTIEMGSELAGRGAATASPARLSLPGDQARALPYTFHDVSAGETMSGICGSHYGDQSLASALARFNGLDDPNQLLSGHRLRIPSVEELLGRAAPATPASPPATTPRAPSAGRTYVVRSGDVLSLIAQREMGSSRHTQALYRHNRDVIDDPDHLEVGVVLKIPTSPDR